MKTKVNKLKERIKNYLQTKIVKEFARIKLRYMINSKEEMAPFVFEYEPEISDLLEELKNLNEKEYETILREIRSYYFLLDKRKLNLVIYDEEFDMLSVLKYHPF
jgi:hypothetical protein